MNRLANIAAILIPIAATAQFAYRIPCETQAAPPVELRELEWQQGTTPLLQLDLLSNGKPQSVDTGATVRVLFAPTATSTYYVVATNSPASTGTYYRVQMPTIGTNTASSAWWYTVYFEKAGLRYWTGNGELVIKATTSTADGIVWQQVTSGAEVDPVAYPIATNALAVALDALPADYATINFRNFGGQSNDVLDDYTSGNDATMADANVSVWRSVTNHIANIKSFGVLGAAVYFPAGFYPFSEPLYVPATTLLIGDGKYASGIYSTANVTSDFVSTASGIRGIRITRGAQSSTAIGACLVVRPTSYQTFSDFALLGGEYGLVQGSSSSGWQGLLLCSFLDFAVQTWSKSAIRVGTGSDPNYGVAFDNVYLVDSGTTGDTPTLMMGKSYDGVFGQCFVESVGTSGGSFLVVSNSNAYVVGPLTVEDYCATRTGTAIIDWCPEQTQTTINPRLTVRGLTVSFIGAYSGGPQTNSIVRGRGDIDIDQLWYAGNAGATNWVNGSALAIADPTSESTTVRIGTVTVGGGFTAPIDNASGIGTVYREQRKTLVEQSELAGYVPTSRVLTVNGTAYDLSADRAWTVAASSAPTWYRVPLGDWRTSTGTAPTFTQIATTVMYGFSCPSNTTSELRIQGSAQSVCGWTGMVWRATVANVSAVANAPSYRFITAVATNGVAAMTSASVTATPSVSANGVFSVVATNIVTCSTGLWGAQIVRLGTADTAGAQTIGAIEYMPLMP